MHRRRFLQAASVGGALGLAGCTGWILDGDDGPPDLVSKPRGMEWRVQTGARGWTAPAASAEAFIVNGSAIMALDPESGEEMWRAAGEGTPAVRDGTVYVTGQGRVIALDAGSGDEQWTYTLGDPSRVPESPVAVTEDAVYAANGALHAIDRATGEERWTFEPVGTTSFSAVPAASEAVVCIDVGGFFYGIDTSTGEELWSRVGSFSDPIVSGGAVYVLDAGTLLELDARTGDTLWTTETDAVRMANAVSNQTLYLQSSDAVYRLDTESRDVNRVVSIESSASSLSVQDEAAFLGSDSRLHGLPRDGAPWSVEFEPRDGTQYGPVSSGCLTQGIVCVDFNDWTYGLDPSSY